MSNYIKDIEIDETALDVEWLNQPSLMFKYANLMAEKRKELDLQKEKVDLKMAELDKAIRIDPESYELIKITEKAVSNAILMHPVFKGINEEYIQTKFDFEIHKNAVMALSYKKEALENLVKLHGQQYFASPSVPRDLSKEWENKQKQKRSDSKVKMKRTRREKDE